MQDFFVCFDFKLMALCSKLREAVNIEIWTVLENIQSSFLRLKRLGIDLV